MRESPDSIDPGLQPERTALAWRRCTLALLIVAIASSRSLVAAFGPWALMPVVVGVVFAVALFVAGDRRYRARRHPEYQESTAQRQPDDGKLLLLTSSLVSAGALAAMAVVLLG